MVEQFKEKYVFFDVDGTLQKVIENLDSNKMLVLDTVTTHIEIEQKYKWLSEHYSNIKREIDSYHPSYFTE